MSGEKLVQMKGETYDLKETSRTVKPVYLGRVCICDECGKQIMPSVRRWKCSACPTYDMCVRCETVGNGARHMSHGDLHLD